MENMRKPSMLTSGHGKKLDTNSQKGRGWNRGTSGRFECARQANPPSTASVLLMKQCEALLQRLMIHQYSWVFNTPVDVVKLKIPDYLTVIKHPMDLGTIKSKIASGSYSTPLEFLANVRLTFKNAMTYNPPGNDVHIMADTLSKFFEVRWKHIEKKILKTDALSLPANSEAHVEIETARPISPSKKRKLASFPPDLEVIPEPTKRVMTDKDKHNLGRKLESLLGEMPLHIIDFLRENSSNGKDCGEDEIEIDIDDLSDDTLFSLRKLLDDYLLEKQKMRATVEPCEIELLNESGPSNSSMQPCKECFIGDDPADEDVDIGGNEPPVSSYPPLEIEKDSIHRCSTQLSAGSFSDLRSTQTPTQNLTDSDSSSSSDNESDGAEASPVNVLKVPEFLGSEPQLDEKTGTGDPLERTQSISGLDQFEYTSQQKPSSVESDCCQDGIIASTEGDCAATERQVSPERLYRAALLKNRFADTILKAREKTLTQGDPEKLRREKEKLEMERRKEKARLQAEAKAAEDARRRAEAEAAEEARQKRELEREAARQALLQMEKTVEINENSLFLEDLEMLRAAPAEPLPSSVDETSPEHSQDGLGSFKFGGSNPLEQLGLYMKVDEEEEEGEPSNPVNDVEEGEID
ncbi:Transcription factor like [Quillaja saponaria]|uniref:Transcription factor like n=1 Tax=Quillaja saponaria TaxID=32244 RepID=A0AAD7Q4L1_QUISA|nr:Transcription factor like [Quillaja saponaria]